MKMKQGKRGKETHLKNLQRSASTAGPHCLSLEGTVPKMQQWTHCALEKGNDDKRTANVAK